MNTKFTMQRYFLHFADDIYGFSLPTVSKVIGHLFFSLKVDQTKQLFGMQQLLLIGIVELKRSKKATGSCYYA
jgi:DNA topoisomerase VI subunit B